MLVQQPKPLHGNQVRSIRKRWRQGYMVWAIAKEMRISEWDVAKVLKADGVKLCTLVLTRNRKKKNKLVG